MKKNDMLSLVAEWVAAEMVMLVKEEDRRMNRRGWIWSVRAGCMY